jgi:hypothetical protein
LTHCNISYQTKIANVKFDHVMYSPVYIGPIEPNGPLLKPFQLLLNVRRSNYRTKSLVFRSLFGRPLFRSFIWFYKADNWELLTSIIGANIIKFKFENSKLKLYTTEKNIYVQYLLKTLTSSPFIWLNLKIPRPEIAKFEIWSQKCQISKNKCHFKW